MRNKKGRLLLIMTFVITSPFPLLALDKVRIGLSSVSAIHGAMWVAEQKALFKKHGIEPEIILIGGGTAGVSALIAGDIHVLNNSGDSVITADLRGADLFVVAAVLNRGVQRVMARPEIKSPEDLKGKRVGITRFGSVSQWVLHRMLAMWGMSPADVQVLQVGSSPAMLTSLDKGGIDAAVMTIPSVFVAEDKGYRVLADLADMDMYYLHSMLSTKRIFLQNNRDQTTRFIKGYVEGIAYFARNKKESLAVLRKKLRTGPAGEKYLERSYDLLAAKFYERTPYPSLRGVKTVLEFLAKDNARAKGADPKSFIDDGIIKELDASGFIKSLYD